MFDSPYKLLLWGRGGHSRTLSDTIRLQGLEVIGYVVDDEVAELSGPAEFPPILRPVELEQFCTARQNDLCFVIAIGLQGALRCRKAARLEALGISPATLRHPSAVISATAVIGQGGQALANTYVGAGAKVGQYSIINNSAVVEHDVQIGQGVDVAPGAVILGGARIGDNVLIGANATVLPNVHIASDAIIGAGSVVTKHICAPGTYIGAPARLL